MLYNRGRIVIDKRGLDLVVDWIISDFFFLPERDSASYVSPLFSFAGEEWYLWMQTNGGSGRITSGHMNLELIKCYSDRSVRQSFSLLLKNAEREKYNGQYFIHDFQEGRDSYKVQLIPRFVQESLLTVVCTMHHTTSAESDSNWSSASASAECRHCKGTFNASSLSSHQNKCMHRPTKCPDCLEVVSLEKWLNEHECQEGRPEVDACAPGPSASHHEMKVLNKFQALYLQKENCDVIIKVKGSEIPVHRIILKIRSPVFASIFRHDMKMGMTDNVEIEDCDLSSFLDFLCFLYFGDVRIISRENVFSLFTAADKYKVLDLRVKCLEFLKKNISIDTFCETITLAIQHSETELISLATHFFVRNAEEILLTLKWLTFAAKNPTQSNQLFIKFVRSVKH